MQIPVLPGNRDVPRCITPLECRRPLQRFAFCPPVTTALATARCSHAMRLEDEYSCESLSTPHQRALAHAPACSSASYMIASFYSHRAPTTQVMQATSPASSWERFSSACLCCTFHHSTPHETQRSSFTRSQQTSQGSEVSAGKLVHHVMHNAM